MEIFRVMNVSWLMYAGLILGGVTAVLFILGQSTLGVVSAIVTGTVWAIYGVASQRK